MPYRITAAGSATSFSDSLLAALDPKKWMWGVESIPTPFADPVNTASYFLGAATKDGINAVNFGAVGSLNPGKVINGMLQPIVTYTGLFGKNQFCQCTCVKTSGAAGQGTLSAGPTVAASLTTGVLICYDFRALSDDHTLALFRHGQGAAALVTGLAFTDGDVLRVSANFDVAGQVTLTAKKNGVVVATFVDSTANRILIGSPSLAQTFASKGAGVQTSEWRTFSCGAGA